MFALCFMFGGIVVVTAQDTQDTTSNQYRTETQSQYPQDAQAQQPGQGMMNQDRERIQSTELPEEVKRSLEGQEYRGWLISGAFKARAGQSAMVTDTTNMEANPQESNAATGAEDEEIYIVELKNGAETKTLTFDKDGQKLEGMEEEMNNQYNEYNQNNQATPQSPDNQYNPNEQAPVAPPVDPDEEAGQTDPSSTPDQAEQSQAEQSTETRTDPSTESLDQSTETQSSQSAETETQTDQSGANDPK